MGFFESSWAGILLSLRFEKASLHSRVLKEFPTMSFRAGFSFSPGSTEGGTPVR
jgi:hypothetical protein